MLKHKTFLATNAHNRTTVFMTASVRTHQAGEWQTCKRHYSWVSVSSDSGETSMRTGVL